jgi:hypothetical protein
MLQLGSEMTCLQQNQNNKKEKKPRHTTYIIYYNETSRYKILCYLKFPFPGDEQEQDVVLGMLSEGFSEFPTIGAVLELSVAEKDLQVKLAARQAYLKQSEYMF